MICLRRYLLVALIVAPGVAVGCTASDPAPVGGSGGNSPVIGTGGSQAGGGSGGSGGTGQGSRGNPGSGSGGTTGTGGTQTTGGGVDAGGSDRPSDGTPAVDGGPVLPSAPKLSTDITPFIKATCAVGGCHDPIMKDHGMDMSTAPLIYAAWVNRMTADHCANDAAVTRVVPTRPADSFLLKMVENVGRCSEMPRMPPAPRAALTATQIKLVRDWITAGAQND